MRKTFISKSLAQVFTCYRSKAFPAGSALVEIKRFSFRILVDFAPVRTMGDILNSLQKHSAKEKPIICSFLGEFDVLLKFVDIL